MQYSRRLILLLALPLLLLLGVHLFSQQYSTALPPQVIRLSQAWLIAGDAHRPPGPEAVDPARAAPLQLPLQLGEPDASTPLWLELRFRLDQPAVQPYWLVMQHRPGASVYLDDQLLAHSSQGSGAAAEDEDDLAQRGLLLAGRRLQVGIPPSLLGAGEHRLSVRLGKSGFEGAGLSAVLLGPAHQMRALQDGRRLWQGFRITTAVAGAVVGVFMLLVWLALRQEWINGVTGVFCLLSALLLSPYLLNGAPLPAPWWRVVLDLADVLAKGLLLFLVARLLVLPQRWPTRLVLAYLVVALPLDGLAAGLGWSWTDFSHPWPWWALGSRALMLGTAVLLATRVALQTGRPAHLVGACAVALSAWVWAYVSYFALVALRQLQVVDVNVVGHAVLIAIAGFALQRRFVGSLRAQAQAREQLEQALAQRTGELQARWEELQVSERQRSAAQERERLLQEMHDGLGSQLVMARLSAERGAPHEQLVGQLDECINEMRLTVDALAVTDGDLTLLLANLRHRMGPRLAAAGLELDWQMGDVPLLPTLCGTGGRELVRIVQEALSNIAHHAGASRVSFQTQLEEDGRSVVLHIADNGRGLPGQVRQGTGLRSMQRRAERIGARISWHARDGGGTELRLSLPVQA